jgi:putative endonuclease
MESHAQKGNHKTFHLKEEILTTKKGTYYESMAAKYLQRKGLYELGRNFRHRRGEIDLIMRHIDTLVFVEVRYRKQSGFGSAEESITYRKQQSIISTANFYLTQKKLWEMPCRFDVVTIKPSNYPLKSYDINWITSAFN